MSERPPSCVNCGEGIKRGQNIWHQVLGWEQVRIQGGTNHIAGRERTGRMMCNACMVARKSGVARGQGSLI